jgi:hypothetical protein
LLFGLNKCQLLFKKKILSTGVLAKNLCNNFNKSPLKSYFFKKKAKQVAKDISYGLFVIIGGMLLVAVIYYLYTELFSRETPSGLYDESSKICVNDF